MMDSILLAFTVGVLVGISTCSYFSRRQTKGILPPTKPVVNQIQDLNNHELKSKKRTMWQ